MIAQVQALAGPVVKMVCHGDGARDIAETFFGVSHAEVLIEGAAIAFDGWLVNALASTHIVSCPIALKAAEVLSARTVRGIIGTVTFNYVLLDQWAARPAR